MIKRVVLLSVVLIAVSYLWSVDYDWGIKYGAGTSSINGADRSYLLHYNISTTGVVNSEIGYLSLESKNAIPGLSQSLGSYASFMLAKKTNSVWLHAELLWQRYNFTYNFDGTPLRTNSLLLATEFADSLQGSINQTLDYITIPALIKLRQELPEEISDKHFGGAYVYFGPSVSLLVNKQSEKEKGIKALDDDVSDFVADSYFDANPAQVYASSKNDSASDKLLFHKTDFVFGLGFGLNNIFNVGVGKDEFIFDCRFSFGLYPIGNASSKKEFHLNSVLFSVGARL